MAATGITTTLINTVGKVARDRVAAEVDKVVEAGVILILGMEASWVVTEEEVEIILEMVATGTQTPDFQMTGVAQETPEEDQTIKAATIGEIEGKKTVEATDNTAAAKEEDPDMKMTIHEEIKPQNQRDIGGLNEI